jgi:RNA polymerase-binding transcription factor DksA
MTSRRKELEAELKEAEEELQVLNRRLEDKPEFGFGEGNTGAYSWEMALARKERVITRIEALQEALSKVDDGSYGRCERCGSQIDPERLEILPTTTLCADCAREANATPGSTPRAPDHAVLPRR